MEKFVTDLDKLLDEFENEDIASKNIYEFSDSSGYNSLKTSTELLPPEATFERNTSQFSDIAELPTPTCSEKPIIESISINFLCQDNNTLQESTDIEDINCIESQLNEKDVVSSLQLSIDTDAQIDNALLDNQTFNTPIYVPNNLHNQVEEDVYLVTSPTHLHTPPKKKLRPNTLFGLTSVNITTIDDTSNDQNSSNTTLSNSNSSIISRNISPDLTRNSKKLIKRPISLNLISQETNAINVPNVEITDENLIPISEPDNDLSNDSVVQSPHVINDESESKENEIFTNSNAWQGIPIEELGQKEPTWIKDELTNNCMQCELPFTMFRRRHHCRACGRLLCGKCCCWRMQLQFSSRFFPKDRVCAVCFQYLIRLEVAKKHSQNPIISNLQPHNSVLKSSSRPQSLAISPFSNSDISVSDSSNNITLPKSVIFSDGIRPGGDLMETDKSRIVTPTKYQSPQSKSNLESKPIITSRETSFINQDGFTAFLPPLVLEFRNKLVIDLDSESIAQQTKVTEHNPIIVAITRNFHIHLEIIQLTYCSCTLNHAHTSNVQYGCEYDCIECWYFASMGMETIGCEEVVIILKKLSAENTPPMEIFHYYFQIYQRAYKNERKIDGLEMTIELFPEKNVNLKEWAGILHIRPTFQCLDKLPLPYSSFLVGILIHRWELPWAKILPLRLLLALGNQSRFYPCSIISDRYRSSVYVEISQTILQIISPVFAFPNNLEQGFIDPNSLPAVPGMWIHLLASQETIVQIPKLSYHNLIDILSYRQSEFNPLALVACFSREADSHLVCCQNDDSCKYYSSAISIQNTERSVTGATMIIFVPCDNTTDHGTTIVEDVLVVRLSQMQLSCVINSLKTMSNLILQWDCNGSPVTINKSFIKIVWTDNHQFSEMASIDRPSLVTDETIQAAFLNLTSDGNGIIKSIRVPSSFQDVTIYQDTPNVDTLKFIWSRFHYYMSSECLNDSVNDEPIDVEDIIRKVSICLSRSLDQFLGLLREIGLVNIGLRININNETVQYSVGCSQKNVYTALSPDQSPMEDMESNANSYICSKIVNSRKFHTLSLCNLPDICIESLNENLVPFLYSLTAHIRTGSIISELQFHIID